LAVDAPMGHERHAARQGLQDRRGAPECERLERLAAREHQHDQRAGQVFPEQHCRNDGDSRQEIGAELAANELEAEGQYQWNTAGGEHHIERERRRGGGRADAPAQRHMREDAGECQDGDA